MCISLPDGQIEHATQPVSVNHPTLTGYVHPGAAEGQKGRVLNAVAEHGGGGLRRAFLTDFHLRRLRQDVLVAASTILHLLGMATAMVSRQKTWPPWQRLSRHS